MRQLIPLLALTIMTIGLIVVILGLREFIAMLGQDNPPDPSDTQATKTEVAFAESHVDGDLADAA